MASGENSSGKISSRPIARAMCQQGQDWSNGTTCIPQKLVRLIGYRDPEQRPSSPLGKRVPVLPKPHSLSDTPIG